MNTYGDFMPKDINVKVVTAQYDEDLEMKITDFLHNQINEEAYIINIHYTDNVYNGDRRYLSAIITYAIEE